MKGSRSFSGVIIADDDAMVRDILRSKLEAVGQTVFVVSNGLEAVELASKMQAALILLDLNMPKLNGLLACQRIRQLPGNASTPIVILTSHTGKGAEDAAARVGATAFLGKPFRSATLLDVLSGYLVLENGVRHAIRRDAERTDEIAQTLPTLVRKVVSARVGPDSLLDRGKDILDTLRG